MDTALTLSNMAKLLEQGVIMAKLILDRGEPQPVVGPVPRSTFYAREIEVTEEQLEVIDEIERQHGRLRWWMDKVYYANTMPGYQVPVPFPEDLMEDAKVVEEPKQSKAGSRKRRST